MSSSTDLAKIGNSAKEFLTSQEKTVGRGAMGLGLMAVCATLYALRGPILGFLDFAISATSKMLVLGVMGVVVFLMAMILMNPRTWTELRHLNYRFVRWFSDMAMKSDPFGRMRAFANEYLQEQFDKYNNAAVRIEDLLNRKRERIRKIQDPEDGSGELAESIEKAKALKSRHCPNGQWTSEEMYGQYRVESQRVKFLEDNLKKFQKDETRLAWLVKILDKGRTAFKFEIEITRMSADYLEEQYRSEDAMVDGLEAAHSALGGSDMAKADKEARVYVENLTSSRMARAEVLMKSLPELTSAGDLRGDIAEDEMNRRLQRLDSVVDGVLVGVQQDHDALTSGDFGQAINLSRTSEKELVPARRKYLVRR